VSQDVALLCEAVRWVDDEPLPGWIEVVFTDADGRVRRFLDKPPIFESPGAGQITKGSAFPVAAALRVTVVEDGDPAVVVTRDVDSDEGENQFRVPASALIR
jgi:hypothetical protein